MKKLSILSLLLMVASFTAMAAFEPYSQWKLFTGDYTYVDNVLNKKTGFAGGQEVTAMAEMANGSKIFAVPDKGLFTFDGKQMQAMKIPSESFAATADIISLAADSKGTLWIGTATGLVK